LLSTIEQQWSKYAGMDDGGGEEGRALVGDASSSFQPPSFSSSFESSSPSQFISDLSIIGSNNSGTKINKNNNSSSSSSSSSSPHSPSASLVLCSLLSILKSFVCSDGGLRKEVEVFIIHVLIFFLFDFSLYSYICILYYFNTYSYFFHLFICSSVRFYSHK
jgi:hypothetical protein